ncbi:MAG: hypothetical protein MUO63_10905 [Desulfobulbaceae bacterium]|nr:hypothetical protein [Desulfobulbaceae bacterium]
MLALFFYEIMTNAGENLPPLMDHTPMDTKEIKKILVVDSCAALCAACRRWRADQNGKRQARIIAALLG